MIVPPPSVRPAVRVTAAPLLGAMTPTVRGVTDHVAATGTRFPNASTPVAAKRWDMRARTVAERGATATVTGDPALTVIVWTPLVAPDADAVSSGVPARVSR